jgi:hypothetical protein
MVTGSQKLRITTKKVLNSQPRSLPCKGLLMTMEICPKPDLYDGSDSLVNESCPNIDFSIVNIML